MKLSKTEAKKKHDEAVKKGLQAKLGSNYLVVYGKKGREEYEVK